MDFSNKVVIITGANSGIAIATAKILLGYGAQLVLVSKNAEELQKTSDGLAKIHGKVPLLITADVTKEDGAMKIENETVHRFGKIDVVINIEGGMLHDSILKPNLHVLEENINLNLRSAYIMTTTFAKHLLRSKGNIVNVGSVFTDVIYNGQVSFNIAKAGIEYLTKASALELASKGIRINCVKPGFMADDVSPNFENKKSWEDVTKRIPLGKLIDGTDIANAIVFLASSLAKNITGASIVVDGGIALSGTSVIDRIRTGFD